MSEQPPYRSVRIVSEGEPMSEHGIFVEEQDWPFGPPELMRVVSRETFDHECAEGCACGRLDNPER